jgi:hypothetical protein
MRNKTGNKKSASWSTEPQLVNNSLPYTNKKGEKFKGKMYFFVSLALWEHQIAANSSFRNYYHFKIEINCGNTDLPIHIIKYSFLTDQSGLISARTSEGKSSQVL